MLTFHEKYKPLTSRPYLSGQRYREYPPAIHLSPYIACFWSSEPDELRCEMSPQDVLVIPDTCMDIIIRMDHAAQEVTGRFIGISDRPHTVKEVGEQKDISVFAIRFYFWAAHLLLEINIDEFRNQTIDLLSLDPKWYQFLEPLLAMKKIGDRIAYAEAFFASKLESIRLNENLFYAMDQMLIYPGQRNIGEICATSVLSQRQMERLFFRHIGLSPKRLFNLVRYQSVWKEIALFPHFNIQDAVYRYGYTDQSHLLKEFKRYHGVTVTQARQIAEENR